MLCCVPGGWGVWSKKFYSQIEQFQPIEKNLLTDRKVPTLFKQIQRKYFFDIEIEFRSSYSYLYDFKKDSGDEHKFCTTLMEKTVGGMGILNSDLFSDQFFYSVGLILLVALVTWFYPVDIFGSWHLVCRLPGPWPWRRRSSRPETGRWTRSSSLRSEKHSSRWYGELSTPRIQLVQESAFSRIVYAGSYKAGFRKIFWHRHFKIKCRMIFVVRERIQRKTGPMTMTGLSPTGTLKNISEIKQVYWKSFMKSLRYKEKHSCNPIGIQKIFLK